MCIRDSVKAMFVSGILMASTNLLFSLLAWSGKSELLFAIAVIFDDMAAAFATVAFVAFISMLVDRTYTATQYALLASIGTAGRTTLAASSGAMVDWLNGDWGIFFILTAVSIKNIPQSPFNQSTIAPDEAAKVCLLYTSPSPRDRQKSRMPSSA